MFDQTFFGCLFVQLKRNDKIRTQGTENLPDITTGLPQNGQEEAPVLSSATISPPQDWHM